MNRRHHFRFFYLLVAGCLILTTISCKSKKLIQQAQVESKRNAEDLVQQFLLKPDYHFISGKAKIDISSSLGSAKGTMYLRTIKDSIIWIAVKKLSVEGGRVLITQDSIFLINRLEKSYQKHALEELQKEFGITTDFSYLQDLILGLTPAIDTSHYWKVESSANTITINTSVKDILHKFIIDSTSGNVLGGTFKDQFNADGEWTYSDYHYEIDSIPVPATRHYLISLGNETESHSMKIKFSDFEVDYPKSIKFSIPDHYTRT